MQLLDLNGNFYLVKMGIIHGAVVKTSWSCITPSDSFLNQLIEKEKLF